ncbi:hypothetical protein ACMDCR_17260 [Labrys okinawensis]|uniref:hypothetical protein n=1 Tax=Labrys okinawensis TaxID=346911 RepID=UPI0039BD368D
MRYEIVRADSSVLKLAPAQNYAADEFISETITLHAVIGGSDKISPVLYPGTMLIGGRIRTTGTYITRVFPMGTGVNVKALFDALLPSGSSVTVADLISFGSEQYLTLGRARQLRCRGGAPIVSTGPRTKPRAAILLIRC